MNTSSLLLFLRSPCSRSAAGSSPMILRPAGERLAWAWRRSPSFARENYRPVESDSRSTGQVQPIVDQARPQIEAIHREAMEKTKQVMDNAMAQIRPILTSDQQTKLDQMKNDRPGRDGHGPRHHRPGEDASDDSGDGD